MHHRRIVRRRLKTTSEVDDGIVRSGRGPGARRPRSAPLVGACASLRRVLHGRVAHVRARLVAGGAPCGPRRPGRRRSDHDPDRPLNHLHDLFRGLGAEQGTRDLGRTRRHRRHYGVADRRPLVDGPGWRWIFLINVPVGLAALALSPVFLRESRAALTRRSYDPAGALTITGALVLLVYAVVEAPGAGWGDVRTILPLAGSAVLVA